MEKISYKLDVFEGPLDLLLYLISKNKLNIYDIRITELLEQYMDYIERMREENIDVASEFLEMAARLVHIKSVSLLPKHEEADELTKQLAGELIEYEEMKKTAQMLSTKISFDKFIREQEKIEADRTYKRRIAPMELLTAYLNSIGKAKKAADEPKEESFSKIISKESYISVSSRIVRILRKIWDGAEIKYKNLFKSEKTKSGMIATFLALLELIHGRRIAVEENGNDITLKLKTGGGRRGKNRD